MWLEVGYYRGHRAFIVHGYSEHFALVRETRITTSAVAAANSATKGAWAWKRANRGSWRFRARFTQEWRPGEKIQRTRALHCQMTGEFPQEDLAAFSRKWNSICLGKPYEPRPG